MEGETYLAEGYQLRLGIEERAAGWNRLGKIARIWQPNRLKGIQVEEKAGIPFLAATQVFGIRPTPRKWLAIAKTPGSSERFLEEGTILVTCSGTVGRAITAPEALTGSLITHDLLRVVPNTRELEGWIYAFLQSPQARLMMTSSHYGQIIKHLEPAHLEALPVPIVKPAIAADFNDCSKKILSLRNEAHAKTLEAEKIFEEAVGPVEFSDLGENGFTATASNIFERRRRLEALFHNPATQNLIRHLTTGSNRTVPFGKLGFKHWVPGRYKRIPAQDGVVYYDSSDLLEFNPTPSKFFADCAFGDKYRGRVKRGWLLIPCSGQVYVIIGTPCLAGKQFDNGVVSNHILRISPTSKSLVRPGYLLTALSHPKLGRPLLKALPFGSSVPEMDPTDLSMVPVVRLDPKLEKKIADLAETASDARGEADELERQMAAAAGELLARFMAGDVTDFVVTMTTALAESYSKARPFGEHECVRLAVARKDAGLAKGALGAIVHAYPDGITFEVEFPDAKPGYEVLTLEAKFLLPSKAV